MTASSMKDVVDNLQRYYDAFDGKPIAADGARLGELVAQGVLQGQPPTVECVGRLPGGPEQVVQGAGVGVLWSGLPVQNRHVHRL